MTTSTICILIAVIAYLVGMLAIGFRYSDNKTSEDFYLGGRKLGPIVTAMSTEASDMSAYLLMGVPGLAFFCGVAEASWTAIGLSVGTYLNWLIVAKRLRRYSSVTQAITVPDFLSKRFRDNTKLIEILGAVTIIVFFVPYTASGFSACGKLFFKPSASMSSLLNPGIKSNNLLMTKANGVKLWQKGCGMLMPSKLS